jgi:hypothetical protein
VRRSSLRALLWGAALVLLLAYPAHRLLAEEEPAAEGGAETTAAPKGIAFVQGWEAGRAQARKDDRLVFLYFGRKHPT